MNSPLVDLISARASGGDSAMADILTRLRESPNDMRRNISELISRSGNSNPILRLLAAQMAQAAPSPASPVVEGTVLSEDPKSDEPCEATSDPESLAELRAQVESMFAELKLLRDRTDLLASALGACCLCWGQDPACRFCHGRVQPGFSVPDESLVGELILPALRMLKAQRAMSKPSSPKQQPNNSPDASAAA